MIVEISRFEHEGQVFILSRPAPFSLTQVDDLWVYENEGLNLLGYSPNRDEALKNLNEDFANFYHEIALEKDENLEEKAAEMKRQFLDLLESVFLPLGAKK